MEEGTRQIRSEMIQRIRSNDNQYLKALYYKERTPFVRWALKNHRLREKEALEMYQNAFTIMYTNILHERITTIKSTLSTYLIGIGKNLIRQHFQNNHLTLDEGVVEMKSEDSWGHHEKKHQHELIQSWLQQLGDPCKQILLLYYFRKFSMEAIAREMGYKNENVAKKKKCQCLKSLRDQIKAQASTKDHE